MPARSAQGDRAFRYLAVLCLLVGSVCLFGDVRRVALTMQPLQWLEVVRKVVGKRLAAAARMVGTSQK